MVENSWRDGFLYQNAIRRTPEVRIRKCKTEIIWNCCLKGSSQSNNSGIECKDIH